MFIDIASAYAWAHWQFISISCRGGWGATPLIYCGIHVEEEMWMMNIQSCLIQKDLFQNGASFHGGGWRICAELLRMQRHVCGTKWQSWGTMNYAFHIPYETKRGRQQIYSTNVTMVNARIIVASPWLRRKGANWAVSSWQQMTMVKFPYSLIQLWIAQNYHYNV